MKYFLNLPYRIINRIKENYKTVSSILFVISQFIIYIYYKSFLNYFSVDVDFLYINIIKNISELFIYFFCVLILFVNAYSYYELFNDILESHNFELKSLLNKIKNNSVKTNILTIFCLILMVAALTIIIKYIFSITLLISIIIQLLAIGITIIIFLVKLSNKTISINVKDNNNCCEDNVVSSWITIIIVLFLIIIVPSTAGTSSAESMKKFPVIEYNFNNYIVLFKTNEYAIVANYTHNKDKNEICILNNKTKKIDLYDKDFTYKKFEHVKLESKGEC